MKIAILGNGGREHAIATKISKSHKLQKLYCIPGNAGTDLIAENVEIDFYNYESLLKFIKLYQCESFWMNTNLMCLGEKTSAILNEIKWKKIFLFNPGEEEFLLYKI